MFSIFMDCHLQPITAMMVNTLAFGCSVDFVVVTPLVPIHWCCTKCFIYTVEGN